MKTTNQPNRRLRSRSFFQILFVKYSTPYFTMSSWSQHLFNLTLVIWKPQQKSAQFQTSWNLQRSTLHERTQFFHFSQLKTTRGENSTRGEKSQTPSNTKSHMVKFKQQALALAKATPVEQHPTRLHPWGPTISPHIQHE